MHNHLAWQRIGVFLSAPFAPRTHVSCCDAYCGDHDPVAFPERRILQDHAAATSAGPGVDEPLADDKGRKWRRI